MNWSPTRNQTFTTSTRNFVICEYVHDTPYQRNYYVDCTNVSTPYTVTGVVTNREWCDRMARANARIMGKGDCFDPFYGAPCMLVVLVKASVNAVYDGAALMQTLMLAAQSLGVNTCWIHRAKEEFEAEEVKGLLKELGVGDGVYFSIGHVALGYANKPLPEPKPRKEDYVHWVR